MRLNSKGHSLRVASLSDDVLSPKSSLTDWSKAEDPSGLDSDVDLPRNSHREVRAKPCCGSLEVAWFDGGGPKT
jgi:hypothetical protein